MDRRSLLKLLGLGVAAGPKLLEKLGLEGPRVAPVVLSSAEPSPPVDSGTYVEPHDFGHEIIASGYMTNNASWRCTATDFQVGDTVYVTDDGNLTTRRRGRQQPIGRVQQVGPGDTCIVRFV